MIQINKLKKALAAGLIAAVIAGQMVAGAGASAATKASVETGATEVASKSSARKQVASHRHTTETFKATCTRDGSSREYCPDCGKVFEEIVIPALGHDFNETYRREPQIGVEGKIVETCSRCGEERVTIIPPLAAPTAEPTEAPTVEPTEAPTVEPTEAPTVEPTEAPTAEPTEAPTVEPTEAPTAEPTEAPTVEPTEAPTVEPTEAPTEEPKEETPAAEVPVKPTATPVAIAEPQTPSASSSDVLSVYTPQSAIKSVVPEQPTDDVDEGDGKSGKANGGSASGKDVLSEYTPQTGGTDTTSITLIMLLSVLGMVIALFILLRKDEDDETEKEQESSFADSAVKRMFVYLAAAYHAGYCRTRNYLVGQYHRRE